MSETTVTLVAVAENTAWFRIKMPRRQQHRTQVQVHEQQEQQIQILEYEPVIVSWVVAHQTTGEQIIDGSIDRDAIRENFIKDESSSPSSSSSSSYSSYSSSSCADELNHYEWTTQVIGLYANGSYVVNFEVVACCCGVSSPSNSANPLASHRPREDHIGETKRIFLDAAQFCTLRQPVVLRCVWRQCQSAVLYVTRQFPGRDAQPHVSPATEKPKGQWLADTDGSPFVPPWVAQIEVYDAETRKIVASITSGGASDRQRHLLVEKLAVSHPYAIRVRAIYNNLCSPLLLPEEEENQQHCTKNLWYGPWSPFTLFRTRGPFLVRAVKTSVRYAHLMVPDILNERYDRVPPDSVLETMPPLHPSLVKAEWLPCVGSVARPKLTLAGRLSNPVGSGPRLNESEDEVGKNEAGEREGESLFRRDEETEGGSERNEDDDGGLTLTASQVFHFDHAAELDDPTAILGLQPDTEYLSDAKITVALPPFHTETIRESRVLFRTQPRMLGDEGADGMRGDSSMLLSHATGLIGVGGGGGAGAADGGKSSSSSTSKKPAIPFESTAMSVESAASLLATETSAKIGWSLKSRSFEAAMQVVSAYEPRFYLVRFAYMRRGAYRLTEADRNIILGPANISKEADWNDVIANTHRAVKHALSSVVWKGTPNYAVIGDCEARKSGDGAGAGGGEERSSLSVQYTQDAVVFSADRTVLLEQLEPDRRILVHVRSVDMNPLYLLSVHRPGALFKDILENSPPEFVRLVALTDRPALLPTETNITAYVTLKPPELDVKEYEVGSEMSEGNLTVQLRPGIIEQERRAWRGEVSAARSKLEDELALKREMLAVKKDRLREERKAAREVEDEKKNKEEQKKKKHPLYSFQMILRDDVDADDDKRESEMDGAKKKKEANKKTKTKTKRKARKQAGKQQGIQELHDEEDEENNHDALENDGENDDNDDDGANADDSEDDDDDEDAALFAQEDREFAEMEDEIAQALLRAHDEPEEFAAHGWYHAQNTLSNEILYAENLSRVVRTCEVGRAPVPVGADPKDCEKVFVLPQIGRGAFRFVPRLSQGDGSFGRRGQNLDIIVRNVEIDRIANDGKRGLRIFINKDELNASNSQASQLLGAGRVPVVSGAGMLTCLYLPFGDEDEAVRRKHAARIQLPVPPETVETGHIDLKPLLPGQYDIQVTLCIAGYIVAQEGFAASATATTSSSKTAAAAAEGKDNKKDEALDEDEHDDSNKVESSKNKKQQQEGGTSSASPGAASHPFCLPLSSSYDAAPKRGTVLRQFELVPLMVCEHFVMLTVMATRELPPKNFLMADSQFSLYNYQNPQRPLKHNHLLGFLECPATIEPEPVFSNRGVAPPSVWESTTAKTDSPTSCGNKKTIFDFEQQQQQKGTDATRNTNQMTTPHYYDRLTLSQQRRLGFLRRIHHVWVQQVKAISAASGGSTALSAGMSGMGEFGEDYDAMQQFEMQQSRFFTSQMFGPEEEESEFARTFEERTAYADFTRQDCFEVEFEIVQHGCYNNYYYGDATTTATGASYSSSSFSSSVAIPGHSGVLGTTVNLTTTQDQPQRLLWSKSRTNKRPCEVICVPLRPATLYDFRFRIRPMDARQDWTDWSPPETFATATPWKLECTAVTEQSATIQWIHDDHHPILYPTTTKQHHQIGTKEVKSKEQPSSHHQQLQQQQQQQQQEQQHHPASSAKKARPIVLKWTAGRVDMMKVLLASRLDSYQEQLNHIADEDAGDLHSIALSDIVVEVEISLVISDAIKVPSTFVIPGSVSNVIIRGLEPGCDYVCRIRQTLPESSFSASGNNTSIAAAFDSDAGWSKPMKLHTLHNIRAVVDSFGAHHCCVLIRQAERNVFHVPDLKVVKNAPKQILDALEAAKTAFASGVVASKSDQDRGMLNAYECAIHKVRFDRFAGGGGGGGGGGSSVGSGSLSRHGSLRRTATNDHLRGEAASLLGSGDDFGSVVDDGEEKKNVHHNSNVNTNNNNNHKSTNRSPSLFLSASTSSRQQQQSRQVLKTIDDVRDLAIPPEHKAIQRKLAIWAVDPNDIDAKQRHQQGHRQQQQDKRQATFTAAIANANHRQQGDDSINKKSSHHQQQHQQHLHSTAMASFDDLDAGVLYQIVGRTVLHNGETGQWTRLAVVTTFPLPDVHLIHTTQDAAVFVWTVPDTDHHINEATAPRMTIDSVEVRVEGKMLPAVYRSPIESFEELATEIHKSMRTQLFPHSTTFSLTTTAIIPSQTKNNSDSLSKQKSQQQLHRNTNDASTLSISKSTDTFYLGLSGETEGDEGDEHRASDGKSKIVQRRNTTTSSPLANCPVLRSVVFADLVPSSVYVARVRFKDNFGKWSKYGKLPIRFRTLPMVRCSALCVGDGFSILASTHDRWYERTNAIESTSQDVVAFKPWGFGPDGDGSNIDNNNNYSNFFDDDDDDENDDDDGDSSSGYDDDDDDYQKRDGDFGRYFTKRDNHINSNNKNGNHKISDDAASRKRHAKKNRQQRDAKADKSDFVDMDETLPIIDPIPFLLREDEIEWTIRVVPSESVELVASSRDVILRWAKQDEHTFVRPMSFGTYMVENLRGHHSYAAICRGKYRDANLVPIDCLKRRAFESATDIRARSAVALLPPRDIVLLRRDIRSVLTSVWSDVLSFKTTPPVKLKVVRLTHTSVIVDARRYANASSSSSSSTQPHGSRISDDNINQRQQTSSGPSLKKRIPSSRHPEQQQQQQSTTEASEEQKRRKEEAAESALKSHCGAFYVASKCLVTLEDRTKVHLLNLPLNSKKGAAILILGFSPDAPDGAGKCRRLDLSVQCTTTDVADALQRESPDTLLRSAFKVELPPDVVLKGQSNFIDDLGSLPRRPSVPILYECQVPTSRSRRLGATDHKVSRSLLIWWGTPGRNEDLWPGIPQSIIRNHDPDWPDRLQEQQLAAVSMIEDSYSIENDDRDREISDYLDDEYDMASILVIDLAAQEMVSAARRGRRISSSSPNGRRKSSVRRPSQVLTSEQADPEIKGASKKYEVEIAHVDPLLKVRSAFVPLAVIAGNRPFLRILLDDGAPPLHHIMFRVRAKIKIQSCGLETELATFYSAGAAWRPPPPPPAPCRLRVETKSDSSLILYFNVDPVLFEQFNQPRFEITFPGESEHVLTVSHPPVLISRLRTIKTYTIQVTTVTSFGRSDNNPTIRWRSPSTAIVPVSPNLFPEGTQLAISVMFDRMRRDDEEKDNQRHGEAASDEEILQREQYTTSLEVLKAVAEASAQFPAAATTTTTKSSSSLPARFSRSDTPSSSSSSSDDEDNTHRVAEATSKSTKHPNVNASSRETDHFRWHWPFPQPVGVDAFPPGFGLRPTSFHFAPDFETRHARERRLECGSDSVHIRDLPALNYSNKNVGRVYYAHSAAADDNDKSADLRRTSPPRNIVVGSSTGAVATTPSSSAQRRGSLSIRSTLPDPNTETRKRHDIDEELGETRAAIRFGQAEIDAVSKQLSQNKRDRIARSHNASTQQEHTGRRLSLAPSAIFDQSRQQIVSSTPTATDLIILNNLMMASAGASTRSNVSATAPKKSRILSSDNTGTDLAELSRCMWQQQQEQEEQRRKEVRRQKRDERDLERLESLKKKNRSAQEHQHHQQQQQQKEQRAASSASSSSAAADRKVSIVEHLHLPQRNGEAEPTRSTNRDRGDDDNNDDDDVNQENDDPFVNIQQFDTSKRAATARATASTRSDIFSSADYTGDNQPHHQSQVLTSRKSIRDSLRRFSESREQLQQQRRKSASINSTTTAMIPRRPSLNK